MLLLILPRGYALPFRTSERTGLSVEGPGPARKAVATLAATVAMGCSLYFYARSSWNENWLVFRNSLPQALPAGHVTQVELIRKQVPKGSIILYLMEKPEPWQFGLWKRSLYPDYIVMPVLGTAQFHSPQVTAFRKQHHVRYVILAGMSLSGTGATIALPGYPNSTSLTLADMEH